MTTETRREGIDLVLTRHYAAPPEALWKAWTTPECWSVVCPDR